MPTSMIVEFPPPVRSDSDIWESQFFFFCPVNYYDNDLNELQSLPEISLVLRDVLLMS